MVLKIWFFAFVLSIIMLFSGAANSIEDDRHFTIPPGKAPNEPYKIYVIGDSVAWGNDLDLTEKYYYKVAKAIYEKSQKPVEVIVYAHSGAVIQGGYDVPDLSKGKESGVAGTGSPKSNLMYQAKQIPGDADLVLVSGGINDVGVGNILDATRSVAEVTSLTTTKIVTPMTKLLKYILDTNQDTHIVVTGYYQIISEESKPDWTDQTFVVPGVKAMQDPAQAALKAAEHLTGSPLLTAASTIIYPPKPVVSSHEANSKEFYKASTESLTQAVKDANNGGKRVVFVDPKFQTSNAYKASDSLLGSAKLENIAQTAHPTAEGATQYFKRIMEEITQPTAALDALLVGTSQSNVVWLETSPTDNSKSGTPGTTQTTVPSTTTPITTTPTTQSQSTTPTTTSQPTAVGALTPEQMDALIEQMHALEKTIQDYHDSGTGSSITPTPTTTMPTTTSPSTPATSIYASEIPVGGTQTKYFSTSNVPPGKVALSLDIRDKNGNTVPTGTKVTVKDGAGKYVQADWSSTGQTLAFGAPGDWIITVDAPGYKINTQYVAVSSSSSTTSFRMYLQEGGVNNQPTASPPLSASKLKQAGIGTPLLSPPTSDVSSGAGSSVSGTYGASQTGKSKANMYIRWWESKSHPPVEEGPGYTEIPLCPRYVYVADPGDPSTYYWVLNEYGYNWIYHTEYTKNYVISQAYINQVEAYLAKFESTAAGVGPLVDEGPNGGGGW